jgi:hypothetical protein
MGSSWTRNRSASVSEKYFESSSAIAPRLGSLANIINQNFCQVFARQIPDQLRDLGR